MEMVTKSAQETRLFGQEFASRLRGGEILALTGELGSGKTTFVQGLAAGLGVEKRVISPTFILLREYKGEKLSLWHLDLYRLEQNVAKEVQELGMEDIWDKKQNVVAVEWAEKIKGTIPKEALWIKFKNLGGDKRKITLSSKQK